MNTLKLFDMIPKESHILRHLYLSMGPIIASLIVVFIIAKLAKFWDTRHFTKNPTTKPFRTSLHLYPKCIAMLQLLIILSSPLITLSVAALIVSVASMISEQSGETVVSQSEYVVQWDWCSIQFYRIFNVIKSFSFIAAVFSFIGLLYPTFGIKSTAKKKHYDDRTMIIFRWVTRGTSPDLMRMNIANNWKIIKNYNNIKMEVVTDNKIGVNSELYGIPKNYFDEIVVPKTFKTPNNTLFKARALYYASMNSKCAKKGCYIFHCDEESTVTDQLLIGVKEFVTNHYGKIGQGLITYRNDEYTLSSYLCHFADSVRAADDIGRFRLQFGLIGKAVFGLKGSFVLVPNEIETDHATSFDCCGELGSITEDSWWAFTNNMNNNRFAWCDGTLIEQSPFTINDLRKQRKRWMSGLLAVLFYHPAKWTTKIILGIQLFGWALLPLLALFLIVDFIVFGASGFLGDAASDSFVAVLNAFGAFVFATLYSMGNLLLIHKNYFEKISCICLFPFLLPITAWMEASGVLSGLLWPDKSFGLVQKEGNAVKRNLNKAKPSMV